MGQGYFNKFNRGEVDRRALGRDDVKPLSNSAELMQNYVPMRLGPMMYRPGTEYIGDLENEVYLIPFIRATDDASILEFSDYLLRVWKDDTVVTRTAVTTVIANGTFNSNLSSWTDADETGATSTWVSGGYMGLTGTGTTSAIRWQTITTDTNNEHGIRIVTSQGPVKLRIGTSGAQSDEILNTTLLPGTHSFAFTPTGTVTLTLSGSETYQSLVDSIAIEAAGAMTLPTSVPTASLASLRYAQSADVMFLAFDSGQQFEVRRRGEKSWSLVDYRADDGPWNSINTSSVTLTAGALSGNTTLTASEAFFNTNHVGGLFRLSSNGQIVQATLAAADDGTDAIKVTGVDGARFFDISVTISATATVKLQRSPDEATWEDIVTYTTTTSTSNYDDGLDNSILYYRLWITSYGSGTVTLKLTYSAGSIDGVCRVTGYTSETAVSVQVLDSFGSTNAVRDWYEGSWSDDNGYPTAVALYEGRLWWAGKTKLWGSVSDAYRSFDRDIEGNSASIQKTVGFGPVDTVNWLAPSQRLIMGIDSDEIAVRSNALGEPLSPTNCNLKSGSSRGSKDIDIIATDDEIYFAQRSGKKPYRLAYALDTDRHNAGDLTMYHPDVCDGGIKRLAMTNEPETRLWAVLDSGEMRVLTSEPAETVSAWSRWVMPGSIDDIVVIPGTNEDRLYLVFTPSAMITPEGGGGGGGGTGLNSGGDGGSPAAGGAGGGGGATGADGGSGSDGAVVFLYGDGAFNNYEEVTGSGSWTVPDGASQVKVAAFGAGGGGSLAAALAAGGGSGAYFEKVLDAAVGDSIDYVIGSGGAAGANGGDTTVTYDSTTYTAGGGKAGADNSPGAGGSVTGTVDLARGGSSGGNGISLNDVGSAMVSDTLRTSVGTQDFTLSGFGLTTPKQDTNALWMITSRAHESSTKVNTAMLACGWGNGPSNISTTVEGCSGVTVDNGANTAGRWMFQNPGGLWDASLNEDIYVDINDSPNDWITDGVRMRVWRTDGSSRGAHILMLNNLEEADGDNIGLDVSNTPTSINVGFKPTVIFWLAGGTTGVNGWRDDAGFGWGVSHNDSSNTVTEACFTFFKEDDAGASNVTSIVRDGFCSSFLASPTSEKNKINCTGYDATGCDIGLTDAAADPGAGVSYRTFYMALEFPDDDDVKVINYETPTSTGVTSEIACGFRPGAVIILGSKLKSVNTLAENEDEGSGYCMGQSDFRSQGCSGVYVEHGTINPQTRTSYTESYVLECMKDETDTLYSATVSSTSATGFTLNFDVVDTSARQVIIVAMKASAEAGGGGAGGPGYEGQGFTGIDGGAGGAGSAGAAGGAANTDGTDAIIGSTSTGQQLLKVARFDEVKGSTTSKHFDQFVEYTSPGTTLTGLDHIDDGSVIGIWADGQDRGTATVESGQAVVSGSWTSVIAGTKYTAKYKSSKLRYDTNSVLNRKKKVYNTGVILADYVPGSLRIGQDTSRYDAMPLVEDGTTLDQTTTLVAYDEFPFEFDGYTDTDARITMKSTGPVTVMAITYEVDAPDSAASALAALSQ